MKSLFCSCFSFLPTQRFAAFVLKPPLCFLSWRKKSIRPTTTTNSAVSPALEILPLAFSSLNLLGNQARVVGDRSLLFPVWLAAKKKHFSFPTLFCFLVFIAPIKRESLTSPRDSSICVSKGNPDCFSFFFFFFSLLRQMIFGGPLSVNLSFSHSTPAWQIDSYQIQGVSKTYHTQKNYSRIKIILPYEPQTFC